MNIKINPSTKKLFMHNAAGNQKNKIPAVTTNNLNNTFSRLPLIPSTLVIPGLYCVLKDENNSLETDRILKSPIREITDYEFQQMMVDIETLKSKLNDFDKDLLDALPLNKYNIQCLNKILHNDELIKIFALNYTCLDFNNINSAKYFDYLLQNKDKIAEKLGYYLDWNIAKFITTPEELDFKINYIENSLEKQEICTSPFFEDIIIRAGSKDEAESIFEHANKYGILPSTRIIFNKIFGEEVTSKMLEDLVSVKKKYNLDFKILTEHNYYNEPYIILKQLITPNALTFKFNRQSGELIAFGEENTLYNLQNNTITTITPQCSNDVTIIKSPKPLTAEVETRSLNGKFINKSEFKTGNIKGEFEINNITEDGKANKTSLVETDKDNGEHIEKHFVSLDGTITDYVFANDKAGNRYLYYKIADKNGNILYETEKKFKILSENHFLSETDGMSYDINIEQNKIKIKKLNNKNESIEYSIKEYSEEDYAAILSVLLECADNPEILKELEKNQITLGDIIVKQGLTEKFSIDKKLLKTLKNLSGEEWFALMKANVYTIISSINNTESTSCGKLIQIGKGKCVFPVLEHEIGHEKGRSLKLNEDTKLRQIFEYEKNLLFTNFPEMLIKHVDYFVTDSPSSNGFLETLAEVNHIINSAQKWERFGMRTLFLQQYFPKTIAYIANKYKDFN